ncbi:MAG TPA: CapA family protein [Myxococcota bacterium]
MFLAGDALINEPWSQVQDPAFDRLVAEMRAADATLVNLETVIHEFKGHAQADCGGVYTASRPAIAGELKWAGVDLVAHANNHAFDYGSTGILETLEHVAAAGLLLAGTGRDLQEARAPRLLACDGGSVALVAMASSFVRYGKAARSRPDLHGRPGLNPLELSRVAAVQVTPRMAGILRQVGRLRGKPADALKGSSFRLFGRRFEVAARSGRVSGRRPLAADADANLAAIAQAARLADLTIASIHAHAQRGWLPRFARAALAAGADVVFCHGPHDVRGIELVSGKPVFYGLGDFVFQPDAISRHPAEAYEKLGLGDQATASDLVRASWKGWPSTKREAYQGCAAALRFRGGKVSEIRLLPLDLQFEAPIGIRGRPRWADPELGREIIERIAERSSRHGTQIRFDPVSNQGSVAMP